MPRDFIYSVMCVSANDRFTDVVFSVLPDSEFGPKRSCSSVSAARRALLDRTYDIVIVNTPLPDEFGGSFAIDVAENSSSGLLLFAESSIYEELAAKTEGFGILVLSRPATKLQLRQSISLLCATRERIRKYEAKQLSFDEKMKEIKIINHAKWLLIENEHMTESDAHKELEKAAMRSRTTKLAQANKIIDKYEGGKL